MAGRTVAAGGLWTPAIWTGKWRWIPETAHYADPARQIKAQEANVRATSQAMVLNQAFELKDGTRMSWTWTGEFNGPMAPITWDHDGSEMIDISFYFLADGLGGDTYVARDGSKAGCEYYRLTEDFLEVWGCYTLTAGGVQYPYRESWERVQ
ncbi:MAG: hypothetical protein JWQ29_1478 [Phenylobacterium sp.]|nr:hypothetical protein [Phenylobacterium sp.]